jgi:cellulose 1,4-beta-cellobiosidase
LAREGSHINHLTYSSKVLFLILNIVFILIIMISAALAISSLLVAARAQQAGTLTTETHPALTVSTCTSSGCTTSAQSIVVDANWRWLHTVTGYTNCYTGNLWNTTICPDGVTCAANCALDGADYSGTYGITTTGNSLKLDFVTTSAQTNVGSRTYLMAAGSTTEYQILKLLGQEFTFDVDVSNLPCGLNGALYLSQMDADGGMARWPGNKAGAKYGTGYCDAQCPQDIKFIDGVVGQLPNGSKALD